MASGVAEPDFVPIIYAASSLEDQDTRRFRKIDGPHNDSNFYRLRTEQSFLEFKGETAGAMVR